MLLLGFEITSTLFGWSGYIFPTPFCHRHYYLLSEIWTSVEKLFTLFNFLRLSLSASHLCNTHLLTKCTNHMTGSIVVRSSKKSDIQYIWMSSPTYHMRLIYPPKKVQVCLQMFQCVNIVIWLLEYWMLQKLISPVPLSLLD